VTPEEKQRRRSRVILILLLLLLLLVFASCAALRRSTNEPESRRPPQALPSASNLPTGETTPGTPGVRPVTPTRLPTRPQPTATGTTAGTGTTRNPRATAPASPGPTSSPLPTETLAVVVTADAAPPGELYPGRSLMPLYITMTNPHDRDITFTRSQPGSRTVDVAHAACLADPTVLVTPVVAGFSLTIPARTSTTTAFSVPRSIRLSRAAPDSCQGASFTVEITLS